MKRGVLQRRLVADDGRLPTKRQHRKPCADCPWARTALPGWLGNYDAATWLQMVHGEHHIDCHCTTNQQCAGAAIFRSNVCKSCRDARLLDLPADGILVFANDVQFLRHHQKIEDLIEGEKE